MFMETMHRAGRPVAIRSSANFQTCRAAGEAYWLRLYVPCLICPHGTGKSSADLPPVGHSQFASKFFLVQFPLPLRDDDRGHCIANQVGQGPGLGHEAIHTQQ
jgi:hypothetical protein